MYQNENDSIHGLISGSSLSCKQNLDDIEQFRKRMAPVLNEYPSYNTTFTLERWLRSYDDNIGYYLLINWNCSVT